MKEEKVLNALRLCVARLEEYGDAEVGIALELARAAFAEESTAKKQRALVLSKKETATVLAALRYWQHDLEEDDEQALDEAGHFHFDEVAPLSFKEIDALCEKINFS